MRDKSLENEVELEVRASIHMTTVHSNDCIRHNISMIQALYQALQISVSLGKCI